MTDAEKTRRCGRTHPASLGNDARAVLSAVAEGLHVDSDALKWLLHGDRRSDDECECVHSSLIVRMRVGSYVVYQRAAGDSVPAPIQLFVFIPTSDVSALDYFVTIIKMTHSTSPTCVFGRFQAERVSTSLSLCEIMSCDHAARCEVMFDGTSSDGRILTFWV